MNVLSGTEPLIPGSGHRTGMVYMETLDKKLEDQSGLPFTLPHQFKEDSWRLPQRGG